MSNNVDFSKIKSIDEFYALTQPHGSIDKSLGNALYGISHQGVKGVIPENRDGHGLVFFTRPQLNLSTTNIRNIRKMYSLLTTNPTSIQRYVRCMLDPYLPFIKNPITTPLVDPELAFIPVLTNTIKNMSGWPDIVLPTFTSREGIRREQWTIGDGMIDIYDSYDIDCTFRNIKDEPIIMMMETWLMYIANVFEGKMSPYIDFITENEIDYNTRIYRIVLDESKLFVKKIAATGASYPINVPTGKIFDFSDAQVYNDQNRDINIRFKSVGAMYNDDILIREFNLTSAIFSKAVRDKLDGRANNLVKIPIGLLDVFNNRGIPLINESTLELEWWINKNSLTYKNVMSKLTQG
jgi:hypothetical protein